VRGPVDRLFPNLSPRSRVVVDWIATIVFAAAIVLAVKAWIVNPYRIPSPSMEPTLHCARPEPDCEGKSSDRVLANRFIYHFRDPRRGEIVVFHAPRAAKVACGTGGIYVKRIIGLPGDVWEERRGYTYIDGKRLSEPYILAERRDTTTRTMRDIPPAGTMQRIPTGTYLMEGDNRSRSCDSRMWGVVPRSAIIGKVFLTYWPLGRIGFP
jgi:signal peptidase I